jgi:hypothetical protein
VDVIGHVDAILARGRGSRLGAWSKPEFVLGVRRRFDVALSAVTSARRIILDDLDTPADAARRTHRRKEPS